MHAVRNVLRRALPALLVALLAFLAGRYVGKPAPPPPVPDVEGFVWPQPPHIEPFMLDEAGAQTFSEADLLGHWTLLFFGYTHCPDICPTTLATLATVARDLGSLPGFADRGQVLMVSVDADRDTPDRLGSYVRHFDPSFRAATAEPERLHLMARQFGVQFMKISGEDPEAYWFDHTSAIFLVAPDGRIVGAFSPPHEAGRLSADVRPIIHYVDALQ